MRVFCNGVQDGGEGCGERGRVGEEEALDEVEALGVEVAEVSVEEAALLV